MRQVSKNKTMSKLRLRKSNLIDGIDLPEADEASVRAWSQFYDSVRHQEDVSQNTIMTLHEKIMSNDPQKDMWDGAYRSRSRIQTEYGIPPSEIDAAMERWLESWWRDDPVKTHIEFEKIHPFSRGNGRIGRILMWAQQRQQGQTLSVLTPETKEEYFSWFEDKS